jgi:AcrR family transcriptional regulator
MAGNGKHLPAEERRAVIVETVLELAAEGNPAEITTAAIAERMRLTQGALFRHFQSKDAVWSAVMEWVAERLLLLVSRAMKGASTPLAALEAAFTANVRFAAEHPGAPRLLFSELQRTGESVPRDIARALMKRYAERLRLIVEEGKERGEIRNDVSSEAAAHLFIGVVQGLVLQSLLAGDAQAILRLAPEAFAIFRRGIEEAGRS